MPRIGDDILPSHVSTVPRVRHHDGNVFDDVSLRYGEIQHLIYPDDARSRSKAFIEYDVYVSYRARNKTSASRMYHNCLLVNPLAGLADRTFFTLRGEDSASKPENFHVAKGSKVLLLCINGETTQAVIIGGLRDPKDNSESKAKAKDLGHHYYSVFNGVSTYIDKDGQLLITYGGKTANDGTLDPNVDKKVVGTKMSFLKDGSWNVTTLDGDDHEQFIFIANNDHTTTHQAKKEWLLQVTDGPAKIKSADGLKVGDATDHMLLGESYRQAQSSMHKQLKQLLTQAATQLSGAVSTAPGAPLPQVQAAGALLLAAAEVIDAFEQSAQAKNSFLSKNNQSD